MLPKHRLDKAIKDKKHKKFPTSFSVALHFKGFPSCCVDVFTLCSEKTSALTHSAPAAEGIPIFLTRHLSHCDSARNRKTTEDKANEKEKEKEREKEKEKDEKDGEEEEDSDPEEEPEEEHEEKFQVIWHDYGSEQKQTFTSAFPKVAASNPSATASSSHTPARAVSPARARAPTGFHYEDNDTDSPPPVPPMPTTTTEESDRKAQVHPRNASPEPARTPQIHARTSAQFSGPLIHPRSASPRPASPRRN